MNKSIVLSTSVWRVTYAVIFILGTVAYFLPWLYEGSGTSRGIPYSGAASINLDRSFYYVSILLAIWFVSFLIYALTKFKYKYLLILGAISIGIAMALGGVTIFTLTLSILGSPSPYLGPGFGFMFEVLVSLVSIYLAFDLE